MLPRLRKRSADGAGALAFLEQAGGTPDAIVLDLQMPRMGGAEFRAAQLKDARLASIPTVVMTTTPDLLPKMVGVRAFLRKPFRAAELLKALKAARTEG